MVKCGASTFQRNKKNLQNSRSTWGPTAQPLRPGPPKWNCHAAFQLRSDSSNETTDDKERPYVYTHIYTCILICFHIIHKMYIIYPPWKANTCWLGNYLLFQDFAFMVDFATSYLRLQEGGYPASAAPHPVSPRAWNKVKRCLVRMFPHM